MYAHSCPKAYMFQHRLCQETAVVLSLQAALSAEVLRAFSVSRIASEPTALGFANILKILNGSILS